MEYQELDKATQLAQIKARARELEQQHLQFTLRKNAPNVGEVQDAQTMQALTQLEDAITKLREMEAALQ